MIDNTQNNEKQTESLTQITGKLSKNKHIIILSALTSLAISAAYLNMSDYKYFVSMKITPAQSSGDSISSKLGNLSNFASIAGIQIPKDDNTSAYILYSEGLRSKEVSEDVAKKESLLRKIFKDEWDEKNKEWKQEFGITSIVANNIKRIMGFPSIQWKKPNGDRVHDYVNKELKIIKDINSPVIIIGMEHKNPEIAAEMITEIHKTTDNILRKRELIKSQKNIEYLINKIKNVDLAEHKIALSSALLEQERKQMMAGSGAPYAAEIFEKANYSLKPSSPNPIITILLLLFIGIIFGVYLSFTKLGR